MNDNDVIKVLVKALSDGLALRALEYVNVRQAYQPTRIGTPKGPVLHFYKVKAQRFGHPGIASKYNAIDGDFDTTHTLWRLATYRISGLAQQDPQLIDQLTASDIVETAADIMESPSTRQVFLASSIGLYRITEVRPSYFINDKDRFEQEPSFDVTLSYKKTSTSKTPAVVGIEADLNVI